MENNQSKIDTLLKFKSAINFDIDQIIETIKINGDFNNNFQRMNTIITHYHRMNDVYDNIKDTDNNSDNDIFSVDSFQSEYGVDYLGINDSDLDDIVITKTINNETKETTEIVVQNNSPVETNNKPTIICENKPIYTVLNESDNDDNYDDPLKLLN